MLMPCHYCISVPVGLICDECGEVRIGDIPPQIGDFVVAGNGMTGRLMAEMHMWSWIFVMDDTFSNCPTLKHCMIATNFKRQIAGRTAPFLAGMWGFTGG